MSWFWYVIIGLIVVPVVTLVWVPLRVELSVKGQGELGKTWAIAAGLKVIGISVTMAIAMGVDSVLQVHVARWRVVRLSPISLAVPGERSEKSPLVWITRDLPAMYRKWTSRVRISDAFEVVWELRRFIRLVYIKGHLTYCTPDVSITGMILGGLYVLSALLAPWGGVKITPLWQDVAKADTKLHVVVRVQSVHLAVCILWFLLTHWRWSSGDESA